MYFSFAIFAKFYLALFAKNKIKINQVLIPGSPPYTPRYFPPLSPTSLGFSHKTI